MEKWILRKAFDGTNILPNDVLWRTKEAQSDACSSKEKSWYSIIQEFVEDKVTDEELTKTNEKYPYNTPVTKEAYYYRRIFCEIFGEERQDIIPNYWLPKWNKDGQEVTEYMNPSARILSIYNTLVAP
jgi:asparagine synthase (glutamine-hydrolysing)